MKMVRINFTSHYIPERYIHIYIYIKSEVKYILTIFIDYIYIFKVYNE